jgi:probable addiction module antidote protein
MALQLTTFDVADYLGSEEATAEYLSQVMADGDDDELLRTLGHIAKVRGMSQLAKDAGVGRESLYKALSSSSFSTASCCGWRPAAESAVSPGAPGEMALQATAGQKLAVTRAYQKAPLKPNGEVSAYLTPKNCSVPFCSLPG